MEDSAPQPPAVTLGIYAASRKGGGMVGDLGLSKVLTSDDEDLERRM